MFRPARDRSRAFLRNLIFDISRRRASVRVCGIGWLGDDGVEVFVCGDKFGLAGIPSFEDLYSKGQCCLFSEGEKSMYFLRWCAAQNTRMNQTCESNAGYVSR